MEIWKQTECDNYEVSNHGRVRNKITGRIMKPAMTYKGYLKAQIRQDGKQRGFFIHRLVAKAFLPNPDNLPQVDHLDNDKTNNHVENLEWVTGEENHRRKMEDGLNVSPENSGRPKIPVEQYDLEGNLIAKYQSIAEAVENTGLRQSGISSVLAGRYKQTCGYVFKRSNAIETL